MLAGVIQIDDLKRAREMFLRQMPDPLGAVAHDDLLLRAAPTALPGFDIQMPPKLFSRFHRAGIGGGIRVTDRIAFRVPLGLSEHASLTLLRAYGRAGRRACPCALRFLSSPPGLRFHPSVHTR